MTLRKHQKELQLIVDQIKAGIAIDNIYASVTPGGGKSMMPLILSELIPSHADFLLWIVPRDSLKEQGEREFIDWKCKARCRIARNSADPLRGLEACVTTYQGVAANPKLWEKLFRGKRGILFLDEVHHCEDGGVWARAIDQLVKLSVLSVFGSGTLARGDGQKIAWWPYDGAYARTERKSFGERFINYSRSAALEDGAILPVHFVTLDGQAEWIDLKGKAQIATELGDSSAALFTALRTEYAQHLLMLCYRDFLEHKKIFPDGKMLIVSPDIKITKEYQAFFLKTTGIDAPIATSDDSKEAKKNIRRFKNLSKPFADFLFTCQQAYEGLSVKPITHIACLTHIRSIPWLEQCFGRGNRCYPGKTHATIYGPADEKFLDAIEMIEAEQKLALSGESKRDAERDKDPSGEKRPTIQPVGSSVHNFQRDDAQFEIFEEEAPSDREGQLRRSIKKTIDKYCGLKKAGSVQLYRRIAWRKIRLIVDKRTEEMTLPELEKVWEFVSKEFSA